MERLFVFADFNWLGKAELVGELCYEKLRGSDSYAFKFDENWLKVHAGIKLSEDINNYPGMQYTQPTSHKTILMKQTSGSTKWTPFTNCTQRSSIGFTWIIPLPPTIEPWEIGTNNTGNKLWTSTPNCKQNTPVISAPRITAGLRWKKSISVKYKAWPWKPAESTRNCILL